MKKNNLYLLYNSYSRLSISIKNIHLQNPLYDDVGTLLM